MSHSVQGQVREGEEGEGGQGQIFAVSDDEDGADGVEDERCWWWREGECVESSQLALDPNKKRIRIYFGIKLSYEPAPQSNF